MKFLMSLPQRLDTGASPTFAGITLTGPGLFAAGTYAAPSVSFTGDPDTGIYNYGANQIGIALNGAAAGVFGVTTATGLRLYGVGAATPYLEVNGDGSISAVASGTNKSITLTPSGTGTTNATTGMVVTNGPSLGGGAQVMLFTNTNNTTLNRIAFVQRSAAEGDFGIYDVNTSAFRIYWPAGGNTLLANLTTNGTGVLQFPAATTSAGGVTFGADWNAFRVNSSIFQWEANNNTTAQINIKSTALTLNVGVTSSVGYMNVAGANSLVLQTNSTTALTLDSSQGATFASWIKTANPSGGTAFYWKLGGYVAGAPAATGYAQIDINGTAYKVLVST